MGHEFTAEVVELGPQTDGAPVAAGDLVTSLPDRAHARRAWSPSARTRNVYNGGYAELMRLDRGHVHEGAERSRPSARRAHRADGGRPPRGRARGGDESDEAAVVLGAGPVGLAVVAELQPHRRRDDRRLRLLAAPARGRARDGRDGGRRSRARGADGRVAARRRHARRRWCSTRSVFPARSTRCCIAAPLLGRVCVVGSCMQTDTVRPLRRADEAAHDRVLVRLRPVRVRRHAARDRRRRDRRHADDHRDCAASTAFRRRSRRSAAPRNT